MSAKTLGILGGGQLGRMSAQAAEKLGITTHIYCPEARSPAGQVAARSVTGAYDDHEKLKEFAACVDVITYEFENIPRDTIRFLQTLKPVFPDDRLLAISQDRIAEKSYLNSIGIPTAKWLEVKSFQDSKEGLDRWKQAESIIKTVRFGYDGKGQFRLTKNDPEAAREIPFGHEPLIMEEIVPFACEISVIIARDASGQAVTYGPMRNEHKNHILDKTTYPAPLAENIKKQALAMAAKLAEAVNLRGVLTLELFVTKDGRLLANEIAPRTHNSGHWTIEGCESSQFENHVRCVCGLPVAAPEPCRPATMINLIGDDVRDLSPYERRAKTTIHLYGKDAIKPGRKMGHVTILKD